MFRFRSQICFAVAFASSIFSATTARAQQPVPASESGYQFSGLGLYESMNSEPFARRHVGLITNQTGVDDAGRRTIDVLKGGHAKLVAIFSPEHGIAGRADAAVADSKDPKTGVPIYSLYGKTRRPTDEMLTGIDTLIFDIQDAGVRFYTYVTTMAYCMEAAAKHHIRFVVFDRPNPLGGEVIEGPMLDPGRTSFTGYFPIPVRYGMTMGELARMFNAENKIGADLQVFRMMKWRRSDIYDQTGLKWIPPSPSLRTLSEAFLYPGTEILQAGGVSVGRGTETPFELVGAPWIHGSEFAAELERRRIPGIHVEAAQFVPQDGLYKGHACEGVRIAIADRDSLRSMRMGLEIADVLHRMYPANFDLDKTIELLGSQSTIDRLKRGDPPADIVAGWSDDLQKFRQVRSRYLLYR